MIDYHLRRRLDKVASRLRQRRLSFALAAIWTMLAIAGVTLIYLNHSSGWYVSFALPGLAIAACVCSLICGWLTFRSARDYRWIAQRVEAAFPELRSSLVTAVQQHPQLSGGRFGFLQESVIREALHHAYRERWPKAVSAWGVALAHLVNIVALIGLVWVAIEVSRNYRPRPSLAGTSLLDRLSITSRGEFAVEVDPGNTEVERGTGLLVMARFQGELPSEATLVSTSTDGEAGRWPMSKSLDDPIFGGRIPAVDMELAYHVEFADQQTKSFRVTVFEYPRLNRADAKLVFPGYTTMEEKFVQDVRQISAVQGTRLTLICRLNKPVAEAQLIATDKSGIKLELSPREKEPSVYEAEMTLDKSLRLELHLRDEANRKNKLPPEFVVNVLVNKPPDLKFVQPSRDVQVSPLEELDLAGNVWDDFGVKRVGVSYMFAGNTPEDIVLNEDLAARERIDLKHLVAFEELNAEPDQLLSYHIWAEDFGPDGEVRRTASDMYFAEVRHFEEIFRQGQQPPGGQQQQRQQQQGRNAQEAQELAELQKQIINGTWKIMRRELSETPSEQFADDVKVLIDSQWEALEQVLQLAQRLEDPQSQQHVGQIQEQMRTSAEKLKTARDGPEIDDLNPALIAQQAAYQALLKLRAREHQVVRGQRGGQQGSRSGSRRSQMQLQQLQLQNDQNRYESQRTAQQQEESENQENRQVLNRLRELSRRQSDLNKRIKELQSALDQSQSEEQREDIRQQLKRLREQQQQILRDTDELRSRMDQAENQERMQEARQQLDQTRNNVRKASEALRDGQVSRAASEGTRAERQFRELQDDFRQRTSGQFNESMREMREQARELDEKQQQVSDQLAGTDPDDRQNRSLRSRGEQTNVEEDLEKQKDRLNHLLDGMQKTIREAETAEPLLADQLYDTYRETKQDSVDKALDETNRLLRRGFHDQAREQEKVARESIRQLRQGIEEAAESVLGNETEALRRAHEQLKWLSETLQDEVARANPDDPNQQRSTEQESTRENQNGNRNGEPRDANEQRQNGRARSGRQDRQPQDGQPQGGQQQDGQQQGGQQQGGQQQSGQQQEGEQQEGEQQEGEQQEGQQQQSGQQQGGQQQGGQQQGAQAGGRQNDDSQPQSRGSQPNSRDTASQQGGANQRLGGLNRLLNDARRFSPIGGGNFLEWSDRLRDVEEMLDTPDLRSEAARIRDRARSIRADSRRHSKPPNWDLVKIKVAEPLVELRNRVMEELLNRTSPDALVPIDRDPVPPKYVDQVRIYYELLGAGE